MRNNITVEGERKKIIVDGETRIVTIRVQGEQGAKGADGNLGVEIDTSNAINGSVVTFDSTTNKLIANDVNTITSLVDGGNF